LSPVIKKILIDTQAFLWIAGDDPRLGAAARQAFLEPTHRLFLSMASLWEMAIKISLGKLALQPDWPQRIDAEMIANGILWLPIEPEHCVAVSTLPFHHRDPFDRLLIAQALVEDLAVMTADPLFSAYGIKCIW